MGHFEDLQAAALAAKARGSKYYRGWHDAYAAARRTMGTKAALAYAYSTMDAAMAKGVKWRKFVEQNRGMREVLSAIFYEATYADTRAVRTRPDGDRLLITKWSCSICKRSSEKSAGKIRHPKHCQIGDIAKALEIK